MNGNKIKPGRMYYGFGCLNWILGFVVSILVIVFGMKNSANSLKQFVAPGEHEVYLSEKGKYIIYHEFISNSDHTISFTEDPMKGLNCELSRLDGDEEVPIHEAGGLSIYFTGKRAGVAIFDFRLIAPGHFLFSSFYPDGDNRNETGNQAILTIGHQKSGISKFFVLGLIILLFGFVSGCIVIYKINSLRRASKQRLR